MIEDLEPPSFEFGRGRRKREPEDPPAREPGSDYAEDELFEEPLEEPEIIVRRGGEEEDGGRSAA